MGSSLIIQQGKLTFSPLGKALENQTKTIKDQKCKQGEKQLISLNDDDLYANKEDSLLFLKQTEHWINFIIKYLIEYINWVMKIILIV